MKKILFVSALIALSMTTKISAQPNSDGTVDAADYQVWRRTFATEGPQTVQIPGGGTLKFDKRGDKFSNVVHIDKAGKMRQLSKAEFPAGGSPKPTCEYPLPDACFATADKSIGLCICKPPDFSSGGYSFALIAKIRKWGSTQSDATKAQDTIKKRN